MCGRVTLNAVFPYPHFVGCPFDVPVVSRGNDGEPFWNLSVCLLG